MSDGERSEEEYQVVSTITYTREAMGECQHRFCSWIIEESMWA